MQASYMSQPCCAECAAKSAQAGKTISCTMPSGSSGVGALRAQPLRRIQFSWRQVMPPTDVNLERRLQQNHYASGTCVGQARYNDPRSVIPQLTYYVAPVVIEDNGPSHLGVALVVFGRETTYHYLLEEMMYVAEGTVADWVSQGKPLPPGLCSYERQAFHALSGGPEMGVGAPPATDAEAQQQADATGVSVKGPSGMVFMPTTTIVGQPVPPEGGGMLWKLGFFAAGAGAAWFFLRRTGRV